MSDVQPVSYHLHITPELDTFTFRGTLRLECRSAETVSEIVLNAADLAIWRCAQLGDDGHAHPCVFCLDPGREQLVIRLATAVQGPLCLTIDYQGVINDRMAGFYRSGYRHFGQPSHIAITQFQEADARRAFPCFDAPRHKAVFHVTLTVAEALTAVANTAVVEERHLPGGWRQVTFAPSPPMSTYLVFLGAGRFDRRASPVDPRVAVLTLPESIDCAAAGLEFGQLALGFCEAYFGLPYPLTKLDLIAVPDFAFGAMENWGAITFRENLLLHTPGVTSRAGLERICEVIAHEIVHQWFGNLVTPASWKYLWLNESFATYFGYGVVHHHHPDWEIWSSFILGQTEPAFARDGLPGTPAIELPGGDEVLINTSTAPIIYSKGGSILRQIEGYIGADAFRDGLRHYLAAHAHGCAESHHLWQAFESVAHKPVSAMMQRWVAQPGHPEIAVRREGDELVLRQRPFCYRPEAATQGQWLVPVTVSVFDEAGRQRRIEALMEGDELRLPLGPQCAAFKLNSLHTGFYRSRYLDPGDLERLGPLVQGQVLPPEDRWGVQADLFAQLRAGQDSLESYLAFMRFYGQETAPLPLTSIAGNLLAAHLVVDAARRPAIAACACRLLEEALARIGLEPRAEEPHARAALRERLIWLAALFGGSQASGFALERFAALKAGKPLHPDLQRCVLQVGARHATHADWQWLAERFLAAASEHERMNLLAAMGCIGTADLLDEVGRFVLTSVPDRNRFIPLAALAENPATAALMWPWYLAHREALERSHPLLYERVIAAIVPLGGLEAPDEVRRFCEAYGATRPALREVVQLSLERLAVNARLRYDAAP
jgi:tricorn protease interacting factor F2/3